MRSRFSLVIPLLLALMLLSACQNPAPIIVVVTATPGSETTPEVTAPVGPATTAEPLAAEPSLTPTFSTPANTAPPGATAVPTNTALPPNFPTPVTAQIGMAEQLFEGGRMFWLQPTGQIWVLHVTGEPKLATLRRAAGGGSALEMPVRALLTQDRVPLRIYNAP